MNLTAEQARLRWHIFMMRLFISNVGGPWLIPSQPVISRNSNFSIAAAYTYTSRGTRMAFLPYWHAEPTKSLTTRDTRRPVGAERVQAARPARTFSTDISDPRRCRISGTRQRFCCTSALPMILFHRVRSHLPSLHRSQENLADFRFHYRSGGTYTALGTSRSL